MNNIEDERLKFYLKNVRLIQEWADLGGAVCREAHQFFSSLVGDVEAFAEELDGSVVAVAELEGSWPKIFVEDRSWSASLDRSRIAGIGIEWTGKVDMVTGLPYVGVWMDQNHPMAETVRAEVIAELDSNPAIDGYTKRRTGFWPVFKYVAPEGEFWEDLDPYRHTIIDEIRQTWNHFGPVVRAALD